MVFVQPKNLIKILISAIGIISCSYMKSGQYIKLRKGEGLDNLSKSYGVSAAHLLASNKGKSPLWGEWYFIPLKRGIVGYGEDLLSTGVTESYLNAGDFIWPVPSSRRISSHFGKRWGKPHQGIDIAGREGGHIIAAADGVTVYSGSALNGYGNLIVLSHEQGLFSVYAHNKKNFVTKGQRVYKGQVIGQLGKTGRTTGPHLHFEIRKNSRPLNPIKYVHKNW